jgi:hypothetical protein
METPLHHHPNDGGYYPDCKRCQLNAAAPDMAEALLGVKKYQALIPLEYRLRDRDMAILDTALTKAGIA